MEDAWIARVEADLRALTAFPDRHVGSEGNRAATALFAERLSSLGYEVSRTPFPCVEWEYGDALLEAAGERFPALVGPYSLPCDLSTTLSAASTVEEIQAGGHGGAVLLLHGAVAAGQLMPKNFKWYNPESHQRIIRALERAEPTAIVAATGRDGQLVGGQYPFPLVEDGDFDIPNAYMKDVDGERLLSHVGGPVRLAIDSRRIPATAEHVVARLAGAGGTGRVLLAAHIDSKKGSPGALDNASGVAALLVAAELLSTYDGPLGIEFVPFNGEDNYANPGEMLWMAENEGRLDDIVLCVNVDDAGMKGESTHVSFYGCDERLDGVVRSAMEDHPGIGEGPQWFQSDHAILVMSGRPAVAVASSGMHRFMAEYAHTDKDTVELADAAAIAEAGAFLADLVRRLG